MVAESNDALRQARERVESPHSPGETASRQDLAEMVNLWIWEHRGRRVELDANYIGKLERGLIRRPQHDYRAALRAITNVPADRDLGFERHSSTAVADDDTVQRLDRRSMLRTFLVGATVPALGSCEAQQVVAAMEDAHRYLDGSVIAHLRRQFEVAKCEDGRLGPHRTLPAVLGLLGAVEQHAREVKPDVRRQLLMLGAQCAEFAGWLYRDARDTHRALFWHDRAMEWAQEADDAPMQGYVLLKKAQLAYDERDPTRMLTLTQAARQDRWALPQRVLAEAAQQEARAEVMRGVPIGAVQRDLDRARQYLADDRAEQQSPGGHYDESLLSMQVALCHVEAGRANQAVELYEDSLTEDRFSPRDYGFFLSWKASAYAHAGEPGEATRTGIVAAERATETNSRRTKRELARVVSMLKPWSNRSTVDELRAAVLS